MRAESRPVVVPVGPDFRKQSHCVRPGVALHTARRNSPVPGPRRPEGRPDSVVSTGSA